VERGPSQDFINIMNSESFLPTMNYPTRITNHSATLIDNIFVNCYRDIIDPNDSNQCFLWPLLFSHSSHFTLVLWLKNTYDVLSNRNPQKHVTINDALIQQFFSCRLEQTDWEQVYSAISDGDTELGL